MQDIARPEPDLIARCPGDFCMGTTNFEFNFSSNYNVLAGLSFAAKDLNLVANTFLVQLSLIN